MKKKKVSNIPTFKNKDEEAKFWDSHSVADYWSEFENVDFVFDLQKPKEESLVLRVQSDVKEKLEKAAKKRGVSVSSLARTWIIEKLQQS